MNITIIILFVSCGNGRKDLTKKPDVNELCGNWKFDEVSYGQIHPYGYQCNDVEIALSKDGSFETTNFPNPSTGFSADGDKTCGTFHGEWTIEQRFGKEKWAVLLRFDKSQVNEPNNVLLFDIFSVGNNFILRHPFESSDYDGDSDARLLFIKI